MLSADNFTTKITRSYGKKHVYTKQQILYKCSVLRRQSRDTNRNIKRSVYCQHGEYSLTFRALALHQSLCGIDSPDSVLVHLPCTDKTKINNARNPNLILLAHRQSFHSEDSYLLVCVFVQDIRKGVFRVNGRWTLLCLLHCTMIQTGKTSSSLEIAKYFLKKEK